MIHLLNDARKVAGTDIPVLITGETGTGKEVIAQAVQRASRRTHEPMLPFNCSTVPRDMLDAQLFGYRRGSFTGANEHFPGIIRASASGTLFLDEIAEMPLELQPKLLRFLESREVHPLGETRPVAVDVRVIAATNVDLEKLVASGRFREDLYYRLNVIRLKIPPLRERREEIPALAQRFLDQHARDLRKAPPRLTEETMEYLLLYRWPGNVRQLSNELRRIAALTEPDALVGPEHLSDEIRASRRTVPATAAPPPSSPSGITIQPDQPLAQAVDDLERILITRALEKSGGNFEEAARALGLSRKGLYLKRQRLGIGS
jgi:transcriptional regulator with PAS, ATPase and Fis domain